MKRALLAFFAALAALAVATTAFAQAIQPFQLGHYQGWSSGLQSLASAPLVYDTSRGAFVPQDTWFGTNSSLTGLGSDTKQLTVVLSANCSETNNAKQFATSCINNGIFAGSPTTNFETTAGQAPGCGFSFDNSGLNFQFSCNNSVGTAAGDANKWGGDGTSATFKSGIWNVFLLMADVQTGNWAMYRVANGVETQIGSSSGSPANVTSVINNTVMNILRADGVRFWNGGNQQQCGAACGNFANTVGWMGPIYVDNAAYLCTAAGAPYSDCTGTGTVATSVRHRFIGPGGVIQWGATCTSASPTATQPLFCHYGDGTALATEHGRATGVGIGQQTSNVHTGTNTQSTYTITSGLQPAPYGPTGPTPGRPTLAFPIQGNWNEGSGVTTFAQAPNFGGQAIVAGQLAILPIIAVNGSTNVVHGLACPSASSDSTTWTGFLAPADTLGDMEMRVCTKVMTAADVASPTFPVSWGTAVTRTAAWALMAYTCTDPSTGAVKACTGVGFANAKAQTSSTTTIVGPTGTTTVSGSTVASIAVNWNPPSAITGVPSGDEIRYIPPHQASGPMQLMVSDQFNVPSGTSMARTWTVTQSGQGGMVAEIEVLN